MTQHYVDQNNQLHELDNPAFAHLLPVGCTAVDAAQADAIRQAAIPPFNLLAYQVAAQSRIDAHYETLYKTSVVNSAIAAEYQAAYDSAVTWLADTTKPTPERVKALAETYGVSNTFAANVVVTKWTEAQSVAFDLRGAARLRAKFSVRASVSKTTVDDAEALGKLAMEAVVFSV